MQNRSKKNTDDQAGRGRGRGRGRRGGRRPRLGRLFAHGDLRFLILKLIAEKPRHGYEIIKAIEEQTAGVYSPSPGVIYPTLTLLEDLDWVQAVASDSKKNLFEITAEGQLALKANRATVEAIFARMAEVVEAHADDTSRDEDQRSDAAIPSQLQLALDDLKRMIGRRHASEPLTKARIDVIAAALSKAAADIERG